MKVYPEKLKAHIANSPAAIYMVSGDDALLVQESCDLIRGELKKMGFSEREVYHVEKGFDWGEVLFSANSLSLFADKKLIEIRLPGGKPGQVAANALIEFADKPSEDTVILLVADRIDASAQRTKWFANLEKRVTWVQIWPIERKNLPGWVMQRLKKASLTADREVVSVFCDKIEGNLLAAVQEIERLRLLTDDGRVQLHHVVEDVADNSRYDVFKLIDTALTGDSTRTLKVMRGLKSEGVGILSLVGLIARETRNLSMMAFQIKKGQSIDAVLQSHRVWSNRKALVGKVLKNIDYSTLTRIHQRLVLIDRMAKGSASGNPWDEMANLLLNLTGQQVHAQPGPVQG